MNHQPVASGVLNRLHRGHFFRINPLGEFEELFHLRLFFVADIQQVIRTNGLLAIGMEQDEVLFF